MSILPSQTPSAEYERGWHAALAHLTAQLDEVPAQPDPALAAVHAWYRRLVTAAQFSDSLGWASGPCAEVSPGAGRAIAGSDYQGRRAES